MLWIWMFQPRNAPGFGCFCPRIFIKAWNVAPSQEEGEELELFQCKHRGLAWDRDVVLHSGFH